MRDKNETKRRRWTPAEDLELQRYFAFGCYTSAEIAEKLGRKKSAVDARKNKLGLTRIKVSAKNPSDVAQILKFKMAGWTQKEIGEVFGVTHSLTFPRFSVKMGSFISVRNIRRKSGTRTHGQT